MADKTRVLIVDDEEDFCRIVKSNFDESGIYDSEYETNALHAIETARRFKPDIILLDIVMTGKDGADVRSDLEADAALRSVPVIFITALVTRDHASPEEAMESGQDIMLSKPVVFANLLHVIETQLAR